MTIMTFFCLRYFQMSVNSRPTLTRLFSGNLPQETIPSPLGRGNFFPIFLVELIDMYLSRPNKAEMHNVDKTRHTSPTISAILLFPPRLATEMNWTIRSMVKSHDVAKAIAQLIASDS